MNKDQLSILDDLLNLEDGLSDWEIGFLDSINDRRDSDLTPKQLDKLLDIARKRGLIENSLKVSPTQSWITSWQCKGCWRHTKNAD